MSDIKIDSANVGENIGVQARDGGGNLIGKAWSWLARVTSSGETVVHSRVEVDEAHRGKGVGTKLVDGLTSKMAEVGGITHEEAFSADGEKLKPQFINKGYETSSESNEVIVKKY